MKKEQIWTQKVFDSLEEAVMHSTQTFKTYFYYACMNLYSAEIEMPAKSGCLMAKSVQTLQLSSRVFVGGSAKATLRASATCCLHIEGAIVYSNI